MIAGAARGDNVHPGVDALLRKGHDMLTGQIFFMKMHTAVGAYIAVSRKQLDIGQTRLQVKRVDIGYPLGANNAVDGNDGLITCDRIVPAVKGCNMGTHFPAHFIRRVMQNGFFEADPRLR